MNRTHLIVFIAGAILGLLSGFFIGKGIYDHPLEESVTRDTVWITDTIPDYTPAPKDSATIKWVTRWLPSKTDTIHHFADLSKMIHDTIEVAVPITSKHYGNETYDAWVSGFEPSLDSIKVYQKTQVITEVRTINKPPNKWELDAVGGIDYNIASQHYTPYAGGELMYKPNRLQVGIQGGVVKNDKIEPVVGIKAKYRIF